MHLNEELSVVCYRWIACCFGQKMRKTDKFWQAAIQISHPKYLQASVHLSLLPTLDSQSFCFKKRSRLCLFLLWERANLFVLSSLPLPTAFSPTTGWTQSSAELPTRAARAPSGYLLVRKLYWSRTSCKMHTANWASVSATRILAIRCWETTGRSAELLGEGGRGEPALFNYPTSAWLLQGYLKSAKIWQIDFC